MENTLKPIDTSVFLDVRNYMEPGINWYVFIGGRGIGKTYSGLDWLQEDDGMLYVRNQESEIKMCATPDGNPFKKLNKDKGYTYDFHPSKGLHKITALIDNPEEPVEKIDNPENPENPGEKTDTHDAPVKKIEVQRGLAVPLATAGKLKGFDFSDSKRIVWDEFIPDPDLVVRFDEGQAFMRFYETVNRNRELLGEEPVPVVMLSNATKISSNALYALGIAEEVEMMVRNGLKRRTIRSRGIRIIIPDLPALREAKAQTALYRAAGRQSKFSRHSLDNQFVNMSMDNVVKRKLIEYRPVCSYDDIYIYLHKSRPEFYVCYKHHDGEHYTSLDTQQLFLRRFFDLRDAMLDGTFKYESYQIKVRFLNIFIKYQ